MTQPASESWGWNAVRWTAWWVLVFNALARVVVALDPFPHWEFDPTVVWAPPTAPGPTLTIGLDCGALLAAGLALLVHRLGGHRLLRTPLILLGAGAAAVVYHAFEAGQVSPDNARIGISWLAAAATGVSMAHLCRDEWVRRVTLAVAIGVIGMLAAKGALQVFVEHADMLRRFEANRGMMLGAQGWSEDSAMARSFQRRLEQREGSGWFGLANVYASFAAASFVALTGMTVLAWRSARSASQNVPDGIAAIVTLGAAAAAGAVVMAGSKAGYAVSALGAVLLAIPWLASRPAGSWLRVRGPILGGPLALLVVGGVLVAVAVRGAIGEAIHEPSILFRWFYVQGASRVFLENPAWGVGPDGFKDAYMLVKPPVAPENVDSPHSILFDYAAKLGLGGVALGALFFWMLWRCGAALAAGHKEGAECAEERRGEQDVGPPKPSPSRLEVWLVVGTAAAPTLLSAWFEAPITTLESAITRVIGLIAWLGLALAMVWVMRATRPWPPVFAGAAIALAAQGQIEMTPVQPASAAWFMLVLGAAGWAGRRGDRDPSRSDGPPGRRPWWLVAPVALAAGALALGVFVVGPVARWERELIAAAEQVRPVAEIRSRLTALEQTGPLGQDSFERIAADLGHLLSRPPPANVPEFDGALARLTATRIDAALETVRAAGTRVRHQPTVEAISRLYLARASADAASGDQDGAEVHGTLAEQTAVGGAEAFPDQAPAWAWLGTVRATRANLEGEWEHLAGAIGAWEHAADLDPHGMTFPYQIFRALVALKRLDEARECGRRVLAANERLRLDPLLQLTENQRAEVERIVRTGAP